MNKAQPDAVWNGNINKNPESLERIRFQDCDPFGHLNNARYLDYFINAREQHLRKEYGLDIYAERFSAKNWVVRASMVSHLIPAVHNQEVRIRTALLNHSRTGLLMEAVMSSTEDELLATGWADFRYIDLGSGRPSRHEPDLLELFRAVELGIDFNLGQAKTRINSLRRKAA